MKGKRHATEQKIRILREADGGKNIVEVCKEHNISEVTFHRWKRQFGQLDINNVLREFETGQDRGPRPSQRRVLTPGFFGGINARL
jgi:transposase-like protein